MTTAVYSPKPYLVFYGGGIRGCYENFATFDEALVFYREHRGHGLVNEDRQCDGGNFAGLSEDERERVVG